ncbi:pap2 superfamily phosphatase [Stylonychia lemnae]|uniref:Pap2 superfamily phosphatase n=1 Tax=Stylonychia lemnae TaxID=5949 RepID=A0A078A376_STYLE|nr:pap2 superfamily phosphatase [Stylonychia lemnae]|eukprot:CDW76272.1 pap2 superfamily phosphatase [Stylonychia lemnae]
MTTTQSAIIKQVNFSYDHNKLQNLLVFLLAFIVIDYVFLKDLLFQVSLKHQIMMNEEYHSKHAENFFEVMSELGDGIGIALFLSFAACVLSTESIVICCMAQGIGCAIVILLKSIHCEPRPFFLIDNLYPRKCSLEHGDPSGHSFVSASLLLCITDRYIHQYKVQNKVRAWSIPVVLILLIGSSRIYNGYHTYNQVVSGFVWGTSTYYFLCYVIVDYLNNFSRQFRFLSNSQKFWNPLTKVFFYGYIIQTALYFYNISYRPTPESWYEMTRKNCPTRKFNIDPKLTDFEKYSITSTVIGAIIGLQFEDTFLPTKDMLKHFEVPFKYLIPSLIVTFIGMLSSIISTLVVSHNDPFILVLWGKSFMPCFTAGFYQTGLSRYVLYKFNLINTTIVVEDAQIKKVK